ncbi:MAG: PepSY domain-containing protein [Pseudomonadota bacterium]
MIRTLSAAAAIGLLCATPVLAEEKPSQEAIDQIMAVLLAEECQMDDADIEVDGDGYELDDVFCSDGQYDMEMNASFEIVNRRKE